MRSASRQLAGLAVSSCLVLACEGDTTTPSSVASSPFESSAEVTDNVVASVATIPDSQLVFVTDQFRITAQPLNAGGELLDKTVQWTVTNTALAKLVGTQKPAMTFKAVKVGATTLKATSEGKFKLSKVVIRGSANAKLVVTPASVTLAPGESVQFVGTGMTKTNEPATVTVTWSATTGAISSSGVLTAGGTPGTYLVIGRAFFGAADTSVVTVGTIAPPEPLQIILEPASASITIRESVDFAAYGRNGAGDSVGVGVTYSATGGTIATSGRYTAGITPGTYAVIASSAAGEADTSEVVVGAAPVGRVSLLPDVAASRGGLTTRFLAGVWNTVGDSVAEPVTYTATCGAISGAGMYTAPTGESGPCSVIASAADKADTTEVRILQVDQGTPFGVYDLWPTPSSPRTSNVAAFSGSHDYVPPNGMVNHIQVARARGIHLVLAMTGGSHDRYKTNGIFDMAKWQGAVNGYDTPAIRDAIAAGVADGTIIGNSVMDEPHQAGPDSKDWGPSGTLTKARVDSMCGYVKERFAGLPVGVGHDHGAFQPDSSYRVCDFFMAQYAARKGNVNTWRDAGLAMAQRDGIEVIFSLNLLNGGVQDKSGAWDCPGTGGLGDRSPNCRMTPEQVRDFGRTLGLPSCAFLAWMYDTPFMTNLKNQAAFSDVAIVLSEQPRKRCVRVGT